MVIAHDSMRSGSEFQNELICHSCQIFFHISHGYQKYLETGFANESYAQSLGQIRLQDSELSTFVLHHMIVQKGHPFRPK